MAASGRSTPPPSKRAKTGAAATDAAAAPPLLRGDPFAWRVQLNNGVAMPLVGFGTYKLKDAAAVRGAVEAGYRLLDTAHVYGGGKTEALVGKCAASTAEDIFVITKQWRGFHGYAETTKCLDQVRARAPGLWPLPPPSAAARPSSTRRAARCRVPSSSATPPSCRPQPTWPTWPTRLRSAVWR